MDSLLIKQRYIDEKIVLLAVVCDGVGSYTNGAFASARAVHLLNDWFDKLDTLTRIGMAMKDAVIYINRQIILEAEQKKIKTASTLSALILAENNYFIVHIGDSRVYCHDKQGLAVLTHDDVSVSGGLLGFIGQQDNILPGYFEGNAIGKTFLICSDGLYRRMDTSFLVSKMKILNKKLLKKTINALPQYVIERGEKDNITVAIVKIET